MPLDSSNIGYNKPTNEPEDLTSTLRRRVDIAEHDLVNGWVTLYTRVPASISPIRSQPFVHGAEVYYPVQHVAIRIRYRPSQRIYPRMRVLYAPDGQTTRKFEILAVSSPDEYRRSLVLTCRELADVGPVR